MFGFLSWQLAGDESDDTVFKKELEKDEGEFKVQCSALKNRLRERAPAASRRQDAESRNLVFTSYS